MKFHPVISIILGIIVFFVAVFSSVAVFGNAMDIGSATSFLLFLLSGIGAGFAATYFTEEKKIRYSIYAGFIIAVVTAALAVMEHNDIITVISEFIFYPLFMGIGGFVGKITDENYRKTLKKGLENGFNPIMTIILGTFIGMCIFGLLIWTSNPVGLASFIFGLISVMIGGFIATFFAKEKKIQYGICVGIIIIIIFISSSLINGSNNESYYILVKIAGYLLATSLGGYIGLIADQHLKNNAEPESIENPTEK